MSGWSIRRRVLATFAAIVALTIAVAGVAYTRLARISQEAQEVRAISIPGLYYSMAMRDAWSDDFVVTERRALETDPAARQKAGAKLQTIRDGFDKLIAGYEHTENVESRRAFDAFKTARASYMRVADEIMRPDERDRSGQDMAARLTTRLTPEFERGLEALDAVVALNKANADESGELIAADASTIRGGVLISVLATLALTAVCTAILRRANDQLSALVGQVRESGLQVSTSVTEIAATAKEQQATANEIAATTTEIGATSREISATSKELVKTMSDVSTVAEQSATLAGSGQAGLTHMEDTMRQVMDAAGSVTTKLATLNEKAGDISQVVTTITKVADQTNLLSLNAAIEAEKAGEYGRGFAVVATEIRRLADQTAVATYDIDQMVKAIQSAVAAGVMSMDKFSEDVRRGMQAVQDVSRLLTQVIQQVQALAPRFEAVTEGMQAQAVGAEQITDALTQLSEAARQTVDSLRQSNLAIDELNQVSVGLRTGVTGFMTQVGVSAPSRELHAVSAV